MKKFLFFIAWIGNFIISLAGLTWVFYPQYFDRFQISGFDFKIIVVILSIFYLLISLTKLISKFQRTKHYEVKNGEGVIRVYPESVKSTIKQYLAHEPDIKVNKIETSNDRKGFNVVVKCSMGAQSNLNSRTLELQESIKKHVKESVGVDINKVELVITKFGDTIGE